MTKAATRSVGTKLKIGLNFIGDLSSIGSPSITQEELDVTTLDSEGGYREFIPGFKDPGEVPISGYFVLADQGQAELIAALDSEELQDYEIIYPARLGASWSFQGFISSYNITAETEDAIGFDATIRVSGKPTINRGASLGLANLVVTGTGGALSPTFVNGTYYYTFDGVTDDSFTVTATAADHKLKLYVDGQYQEDLESGQASSSIPFEDNGSRKVTIVAQEQGRTSVVYEVVVVSA